MADGTHDFLYRPSRGRLEAYDPKKHGVWQIVDVGNGRMDVAEDGAAKPDAVTKDVADAKRFALESHLRDYLAANLSQIEPGLELYTQDGETDGVEYDTQAVGKIDVLAVDANGVLVVIELKVGQTPDQVCGQLMRYMSWVRRHLADGKQVRASSSAKRCRMRSGMPSRTSRTWS